MLKSKQLSVFTIILLLVVAAGALFAASLPEVAPFPTPITNSAVTGLKMKGQWFLFSLMGMGAKKAWDDVSNSTYGVSIEGGDWTALRSVPGAAGRLGRRTRRADFSAWRLCPRFARRRTHGSRQQHIRNLRVAMGTRRRYSRARG